MTAFCIVEKTFKYPKRCHLEVARSVAGRGRSWRSDQEHSLTIRSVGGSQPVTNGWRVSLGMRRTTTVLRLGILACRSRQ